MVTGVKVVAGTLRVTKAAYFDAYIFYTHTTVTKVWSNSRIPSAIQQESMDSEELHYLEVCIPTPVSDNEPFRIEGWQINRTCIQTDQDTLIHSLQKLSLAVTTGSLH